MKVRFQVTVPYAYKYLTKVLAMHIEGYSKVHQRAIKEVLYILHYNTEKWKRIRELNRLVTRVCEHLDEIREDKEKTTALMSDLASKLLAFYFSLNLRQYRKVGYLIITVKPKRASISEEGINVLYRCVYSIEKPYLHYEVQKRKVAN